MLRAIVAAFLLLIFASGSVYAHSPYTHKLKYIKGPDEQRLLIEEVYGDGIVAANPVALQVRNDLGAPIAQSPAGVGVGVLCLSYEYCYAFPDTGIGIAQVFRFAFDKADYKKNPAREDASSLLAYMQNPEIKSINGWDNSNEPGSSKPENFVTANPLLTLISPIFIFAASWKILLGHLFVFFIFFYLWRKSRSFKQKTTGAKTIRLLVKSLAVLGFLFALFASAILMMIAGTPILHMILNIIGARYLAKSLIPNP